MCSVFLVLGDGCISVPAMVDLAELLARLECA
jgi:hypothetical protein